MPKGMNAKAVEANARKASAKDEAEKKAEKAKEESYWREQGEGAKSKAQAKREEQEKQRQEAAAKRAEAKRLADEEAAALTKPTKGSATKAPRVGLQKVTAHQLAQQKELEEKERAEALRERNMAVKREVSAEAYSALVERGNVNRQEDVIEARNVDEALSALTIADAAAAAGGGDKHPEKRMRAAWLAYEARELPALQAEKPRLKMSQYKDMLWKTWQKSPDNPLNQAAAAK